MKYLRKVIRIKAEDSPNVKLALEQQEMGLPVTNEIVTPGVLTWEEYQRRRKTWDAVRQCVGLDGMFYEGADALMFPPEWLNAAESYAARLGTGYRVGLAIGVDTAEGGDNTSATVVDHYGIIKQISMKTPDTSIITGWIIGLMTEYKIKPNNVLFDKGGGGHEHADRLVSQGYRVRRISFGEGASKSEPSYFSLGFEDESKYTFKNARAEMYWNAREKITPTGVDTDGNPIVQFGIPAEYSELRRQLAPINIYYDEEGRIYLPPKRHKSTARSTTVQSLEEILGCSPDEADSFVLAVHALGNKKTSTERKQEKQRQPTCF